MKNLKNTLAALVLFVMLVLGTTSANAGLIMSDRSAPGQEPCGGTEMTDIILQATGIVISGFTGIVISGRDGLLMSDRNACSSDQRTGILMSD